MTMVASCQEGPGTTEGQNDKEFDIKSHAEGPGGQGHGQGTVGQAEETGSTTSRQSCRVLNCVL